MEIAGLAETMTGASTPRLPDSSSRVLCSHLMAHPRVGAAGLRKEREEN
jgi:hypothetical protein